MSIFPFTSFQSKSSITTKLKLFAEMAYDFENNCLLKKAGKYYMVYKDEAIKIWIWKALKTQRYIWQAYTHTYGNDIAKIIGKISNMKAK